jgi:Fe-S cluster assembly ATP-binding protein
MSARLVIDGLRGGIPGQEIVRGLSLEVPAGEVHAVMGPNGSGKSTLSNLLMGRPGYEVTGGSARIEVDGRTDVDLLGLPTWERVRAGLFLAMQRPVEVPGVLAVDALIEGAKAAGRDPSTVRSRLEAEADRIGFDRRFLERSLNVDLSGGERKRNETVQLAVLQPRFAILDEIDSGLDIDALSAVSRRVEELTNEDGVGVLAITHFSRLLTVLHADRIHVLWRGRIVASGGPELADQLEVEGYAAFADDDADEPAAEASPANAGLSDPFADPFADPLA